MARDVTEHAKPPRAVFLPWMMGHHFGVPFHRDLQRRVILECLDLLVSAERSGEIRTLAIPWPQVRREGIAIERRLGLRT
ncbi:MAG: hypothetical protein KY467_19115 [Gemmatimonadetes bacterium]|nr:hypothetical protein [Gemmatimonadota bacterium]